MTASHREKPLVREFIERFDNDMGDVAMTEVKAGRILFTYVLLRDVAYRRDLAAGAAARILCLRHHVKEVLPRRQLWLKDPDASVRVAAAASLYYQPSADLIPSLAPRFPLKRTATPRD